PVDTFMIHRPALPPKQDMKPPVTVANPHGRQVLQPEAQRCLRVARRSGSLGWALETGRLAGPPLADIVGPPQMSHEANSGPQNFRRRTSCNIVLSRLRS